MILNNKLKSLIKKKIKSIKINKINKNSYFKKYEGQIKKNIPHGWGTMVLNDNSIIYGNFENGKLNDFGIYEKKGLITELGFFKNNKFIGETLKIYMNKKDKKLNYEPYVGEKKVRNAAHGKGVIRGIWKYGKLTKVLNKLGNTSYISLFDILSENMTWDESIDTQKKVIAVIKDISN